MSTLAISPNPAHRSLVRHCDVEALRRFENLSPRENEFLRLMLDGHTTKEIASKLGISFKTGANHRTNIFLKTGVHNIVVLVRMAIRAGIVEP